MSAARRRIVLVLQIGFVAVALFLFLSWRLCWSWRYLIPANRRALSAIRVAHISIAGLSASEYRIVRATDTRCYVMAVTQWQLGKGADFEVWGYRYSTGQVERVAVLCKYVNYKWRAAITAFENTGQCQSW
ncbi:unnamed protein product [Gemmata massiliana]|uniref:Uncharacterized protein n=2 Tax=Gemmata massiliana TaxID=1210884 RepID=A0A6P2CWT7_9BACT|nr:unnamed protein product [Gemmata massiliana]